MGNVGLPEVLVIAVIALLVFGPRRLPEIARNAGRALHEFKRVTGELTDELKAGLDDAELSSPSPSNSEPLTHTEMLPVQHILDGHADAAKGPSPREAGPKEAPPGKDV